MRIFVPAFILLHLMRGLLFAQAVGADVVFDIEGPPVVADSLRNAALRLTASLITATTDTTGIRASTAVLSASGLFSDVSTDVDSSHIVFTCKPARHIGDIRIKNPYPLFGEEVEKALSISAGKVFTDTLLRQQGELVARLYRNEGFIAPVATASLREITGNGKGIVDIRVQPGGWYHLTTITLSGNRAFSGFRLKQQMKAWWSSLLPGSSGRFVEREYRQDIKTLTAFYRSHHFPEAVIRDSVVTDPQRRTVHAIISITEGPRYRIAILPHRLRGVPVRALLRDSIAIYRSGSRGKYGVRRSAASLEAYLNQAGFADAHIAIHDTLRRLDRWDERLIRFTLEPGRRTLISTIAFRGNSGIGQSDLRGQMLCTDIGGPVQRAFFRERLEEDLDMIRALYRSRGFLRAKVDAEVSRENESAVAITVTVSEGVQTRIGRVTHDLRRFSGVKAAGAVTVHVNDPFSEDAVAASVEKVQAQIVEQGFPHAKVFSRISMQPDSAVADVEFIVSEGPNVTLGEVRFNGLLKTQPRIPAHEFSALQGKPLSLKAVVDAQKRLRDLGLFNSVRVGMYGLAERRDTVHMVIDVTEKRPLYGSIDGGYQTEKKLFVNARAGTRNLLGVNKEAWVDGELGQIDEALIRGNTGQVDGKGELGIANPRFLGVPLRAMAEVFGERRSELNLNWQSAAFGVSTALTASPDRHLLAGLGAIFERRQLSSDGVSVIPDSLRPRTVFILTPTFSLDRRDSFTRPRRGVFIGTSIDISKGIVSGEDNFLRVQGEVKGFLTPVKPLTIAAVARAGGLRPYGGTLVVPADRRFTLGGTGSVRGFRENLFRGSTPDSAGNYSLSASLELRIAAGDRFELPLFIDGGRLENNLRLISPAQFRTAAGLGIRYHTPIGPIGILYGWKLDRRPGEDAGAFHFSLGYTF